MYHWIFLFRRFGKLFLQLLTFQKVRGILNTVQKLERMWVKTIQRLRGCLHVKFHPRMKLVPGWNHSCLWWNASYCLHVFAEMKFDPRMNSSQDERQGWKKEKKTCKHFIHGWNFKMNMFFNFWVCIQVCCPNSACLNIMKVWI